MIEAVMSKTVGSILKATVKRDPHEAEFIQAVHEIIDAGGKEFRFTWLRVMIYVIVLNSIKV